MSVRGSSPLLAALLAIGCGGTVMHFGETNGPDGGGAGGSGVGAPTVTIGAGGSAIGAGGATTGTAGSGQGGSGGQQVCPPNAGPSEPLSFTNLQYDNTVRDLLGYQGTASVDFDLPMNEPFVSNFQRVSADPLDVSRLSHYVVAAQGLAADAVNRNLDKLAPCSGQTIEEQKVCAESFVVSFGAMALRGPIPDELGNLMSVYVAARQDGSYGDGIRAVIATILSMPRFYMLEQRTTLGSFAPLSPYGVASRLSYFITQSTPDRELLVAARSGALATKQGIEVEARRLLAKPGAHESVREFFLRWMRLDSLDVGIAKPTIPEFAGIRSYMRTETQLFAESVFFGSEPWSALLLSTKTFLNEPLALIYGQPGIVGADMRAASVNPKQRSGILTQPSFLSVQSHDESSPTLRGKFVLGEVLCMGVPPPPASVPPLLPELPGNATTRERLIAHRSNPTCATCHALIDTFGFAFEHYDAIGRYRDTQAGAPVDAKGDSPDPNAGLKGPFDGAVDLSSQLAASRTVRSCMATQWLRFALMRYESELDACSIETAASVLERGGTFADLAVAIATSDSFRHVRW